MPGQSFNTRTSARLAVLLLAMLFFHAPAFAEDWPQWRGPAGIGVSSEHDFPIEWDDRRNVCWHVPLPDRGNSTPIVWGDRVLVTQAIESGHRRVVICFARSDGRLLWQSGVAYPQREPTNGQNPYCSSSPATDGSRVVAYFGSAGLFCFDMEGHELWHRDVGAVDSWQGSGSSPILYEDLCILNAGPGTHAALIACDARTGKVLWLVRPPREGEPPATAPAAAATLPADPPEPDAAHRTGFDNAMTAADPRGAGGFLGSWSTPVMLDAGGRQELIVVHPYRIVAYEPRSGKPIWWCAGPSEQAFASPAVGEGLLVASGHRLAGGGTRVLAIRLPQPSATGDLTAAIQLWKTDLPRECVGSGVVAAGRVFLVTQFGSIICLDQASGKKQWEKRLAGRGSTTGSWSSLLLAGGKLLIPNQAGEVFVLRASPQFELLLGQSRLRRTDLRVFSSVRWPDLASDSQIPLVLRK